MRAISIAVLAVVAVVGCGGDDGQSAATTTTAETGAHGSHEGYSWSTDLVDDDGRICLEAKVEPSILGTSESADLDEFLNEQLWDPPACAPALAASGPQFGLVFVPYVYQGERYTQPVVIGLVIKGADDVELVHASSNATPVTIEGNGTFAAFPADTVAGLSLQVDGAKYLCPTRVLGGGLGHEISHCERA